MCILLTDITGLLLAELLYEEDKASGNENLNYFMSFLIAESNVKIYEYNRIIRDFKRTF
jgi:uncharacterized protein (DUF1015 family)